MTYCVSNSLTKVSKWEYNLDNNLYIPVEHEGINDTNAITKLLINTLTSSLSIVKINLKQLINISHFSKYFQNFDFI